MNEGSDQVRQGDPPATPPPSEKNPYNISWWWFFATLLFVFGVVPCLILLYGLITDPMFRKLVFLRLAG